MQNQCFPISCNSVFTITQKKKNKKKKKTKKLSDPKALNVRVYNLLYGKVPGIVSRPYIPLNTSCKRDRLEARNTSMPFSHVLSMSLFSNISDTRDQKI